MYNLDPTSARKADTQGNQIPELRKYLGALTHTEYITAKSGTKWLNLHFTSDAGQKTKVSIYVEKTGVPTALEIKHEQITFCSGAGRSDSEVGQHYP